MNPLHIGKSSSLLTRAALKRKRRHNSRAKRENAPKLALQPRGKPGVRPLPFDRQHLNILSKLDEAEVARAEASDEDLLPDEAEVYEAQPEAQLTSLEDSTTELHGQGGKAAQLSEDIEQEQTLPPPIEAPSYQVNDKEPEGNFEVSVQGRSKNMPPSSISNSPKTHIATPYPHSHISFTMPSPISPLLQSPNMAQPQQIDEPYAISLETSSLQMAHRASTGSSPIGNEVVDVAPYSPQGSTAPADDLTVGPGLYRDDNDKSRVSFENTINELPVSQSQEGASVIEMPSRPKDFSDDFIPSIESNYASKSPLESLVQSDISVAKSRAEQASSMSQEVAERLAHMVLESSPGGEVQVILEQTSPKPQLASSDQAEPDFASSADFLALRSASNSPKSVLEPKLSSPTQAEAQPVTYNAVAVSPYSKGSAKSRRRSSRRAFKRKMSRSPSSVSSRPSAKRLKRS